MTPKDFKEENNEITRKAYELYEKHGFKDGNDFIDWLEAERMEERLEKKQADKKSKRKHNKEIRNEKKHNKQMRNILFAIVAILCVIVVLLLGMLLKKSPDMNLSEKSLTDLKVMLLVLDPKPDEEVVAFGDTHFDYNESALTDEAKTLLDKDVSVLKENPEMKVRMAGYTSASGTKEFNQELSEKRANEVRNYLIEKGIAPERITVIGYGRTKPALYEVSPGDIDTKEARANMRVLFEIVVK